MMEWLKIIILVPVTMACATGGTIGLIWLIKRFAPEMFAADTESNEGRQ